MDSGELCVMMGLVLLIWEMVNSNICHMTTFQELWGESNSYKVLSGAHNEKERTMLNTVREPTFRPSMPK